MSQHLRILKDTGLVTERRQGTRRYYKARMEGLAELRAFLEVLLGEESWFSDGPGAGTPPAEPAAQPATEPAKVVDVRTADTVAKATP